MTGILFHGPEVFDSGWARRLIGAMKALGPVRCVLAGTMSRTALIDSCLRGVACPGAGPSACLRMLEPLVDLVLLATFGKSRRSGLVFGGMVVERAAPGIPVVQAECGAARFVEWREGCGGRVIRALERLGCRRGRRPRAGAAVWEEGGAVHRRMTTAAPGDSLLVDGIIVGRAAAREIVFVAEGRRLTAVRGAAVKAHGLEKLERLGGVDLRTAKLASARRLRREDSVPRVRPRRGKGMVFIDHAGMHVYELIRGAQGAVTVGDDTTAVAGDILHRFRLPLIGIVDGDGDGLLARGNMPPGSCVLTVKADDQVGCRVSRELFHGRRRSALPFAVMKARILELAASDLLSVREAGGG